MGTNQVMVARHDPGLVALSVFVSLLAAYAAYALVNRLRAARGRTWLAWLAACAVVDGIGTWSMHYTGKMALRLPVPVLFDWPTVLLSLLVGITGSGAALFVMRRGRLGWPRAVAAGVLLGGVGVSGMHYTAMAAMRTPGMHHHYSPSLVTLSIMLGVALTLSVSSLAFLSMGDSRGRRWKRHSGAWLRGSANPVMHYTAMAAATFTYSGEAPDLSHAVNVFSLGVLGVSVVPVMVLVVALLTSVVDRLQKQRTLLNELFEQAPQAVALLSSDATVVRVNREFTKVFGYGAKEAQGRGIVELIVPDEARHEFQKHMDMLARGQRVDAEGVRRRKDGSPLYVAMVHVPLTLPGGRIEMYAIYRDITARKQMEDALREQEIKYRNLYESSHDVIALSDEAGDILDINRRGEQLTGYSQSELRRMNIFRDLLFPEDRGIYREVIKDVREGKAREYKVRWRTKAGAAIHFDVVSVGRFSATGEFLSTVCSFRDISERKRAEDENRRLLRDLGERVKELTALHEAARVLQQEEVGAAPVLRKLAELLPPAFQYPEVTAARVRLGPVEAATAGFAPSPSALRADFTTADGRPGSIEVVYTDGRPPAVEGPFLAEERALVNTLADMLRAAYDRRQAEDQFRTISEQLRALSASLSRAREEEGTRIAREIHDELGAALSSLRWDLEEVKEVISESADPSQLAALREKLEALMSLTDRTVNTVRRIASELRPGALDDLGLVEAIEWQARQFQERTGIVVNWDCSLENPDLSGEQSTAVFRIFQEALTNVLRHAQATRVEVGVEERDGEFILTIGDNGRGITEEEKSGLRSLGLLGMRERAHLIGGEIDIAGVAGRGTTVTVRVTTSGRAARRSIPTTESG